MLGATYQLDAADGLPYCLTNAAPIAIDVRAAKRAPKPKPSTAGDCDGAGAVACYPGYYASEATGACEPCGINNLCSGGSQPTPRLVECPTGTGTLAGETSAYDPGQCVVLPCDPCGAAAPDLFLTSDLSVYKQPGWTTGIPTGTDTAELQCTLDNQDSFICQLTSSCTLNDIAVDNQGNFLLIGRRKGSGAGTGWLIRVDPEEIVPGEPCPYTVLIGDLEKPWTGLGASRGFCLSFARSLFVWRVAS